MKDTVILFARAPRLGAVKRRLAKEIGDRQAYRFHAQSLARLIRQMACERRFRAVIALTPDRSRMRLPVSFSRIDQGSGDLGVRMQRAFRKFTSGRVVLAGCDIPEMTMSDLKTALTALGSADAVFGPATDGGYWLVGMSSRRPAQPFRGVRWSTRHALSDTARNFSHHRVAVVRALRDIDSGRDFALWRSTLGGLGYKRGGKEGKGSNR